MLIHSIYLLGTTSGFSYVEYRLRGPLRCYQAYKTCEQVNEAGLPSGTYYLDVDGIGDTKPYPVYCSFAGDQIKGSVYHNEQEVVSSS